MSDSTPPAPPVPPPSGQPVSGQPVYGQPGPPVYGQPYVVARPTNTLSIVALVLSLVGIATGLSAIGGIVCGHIALAQIKRTGENGRGMALAGVIVGYALVGFWILAIIAYVIVLIVLAGIIGASASYSTY